MCYKHFICVLFFIFVFFLETDMIFTFNFAIAQESSAMQNEKKVEDKNSTNEKEKDLNDDLDEDEIEPNITTKIYRSVDPSIDLLEKYTKLQSVLEDDVLTKDELLGKPIKNKTKIIKRARIKNVSEKEYRKDDDSHFLPWIVFFTLIFLLAGIFNIVTKVKV